MALHTASLQQEIPEENRLEDELQKSPEHLRSLLRGMPLPVHIWRRRGDDFVLVDCNRRMEEITGGKVKEQLGH
ncbi:MAG: PAS domain-containing protein, partial [Desulfobacteraceae bacterium]|nr:PAS domain-containing protein [Desulfobacteraceae bacterium]